MLALALTCCCCRRCSVVIADPNYKGKLWRQEKLAACDDDDFDAAAAVVKLLSEQRLHDLGVAAAAAAAAMRGKWTLARTRTLGRDDEQRYTRARKRRGKEFYSLVVSLPLVCVSASEQAKFSPACLRLA